MISALDIEVLVEKVIQFQSRNRVSCDFCKKTRIQGGRIYISCFNLVIEFLVISATPGGSDAESGLSYVSIS